MLSLDQAVALALGDQPTVQAYRREADASEQAAETARTLPDPQVSAGVQNLPVTGSMAFNPSRDTMTMYTIGVMREQVRRSKREAEAYQLHVEAVASRAEASAEERQIRRAVMIAWLLAVEAEAKQRLLKQVIADLKTGRQVMEAGVPTGASTPSLALQAQAEVAIAEADLAQAGEQEMRARAELARWIGQAADRPLPDRVPALKPPPEVEADIAGHPLLRVAEAQEEAARGQIGVARAQRKPDISWSAMYGWRPSYDNMVSVQVSIPLFVNRKNRQDRKIVEASARADAARLRVESTRRELRAAYAAALADYRGADARLNKIIKDAIPALEASFEAARARYAAGPGSLELPLTIVRRYVETNIQSVEEQAKRARAAVELAYLSGDLVK
ncbi:TolC family protein [Sphingomonas sp. ID1715]|uniref:TolC family protein n=1 Tax=Sphingomonas sp. ID1715 TaxID=1656898 RepID=UPI0014897454|nr:TolC family protein [Sphingomonas sp. ID1715]NNM77753.1 TolC family protein [Sphingomonas sp. ID1715]